MHDNSHSQVVRARKGSILNVYEKTANTKAKTLRCCSRASKSKFALREAGYTKLDTPSVHYRKQLILRFKADEASASWHAKNTILRIFCRLHTVWPSLTSVQLGLCLENNDLTFSAT